MDQQHGIGIKSFEAILNEAAIQRPEAVAFTLLENDQDDNESITFNQLKNQVDFVASVLYSRFDVGDRVVLVYPTSIEFVVAFLGCLAAGVVAVPVYTPRGLNPKEREDWVGSIINKSNAKAILTTDVLLGAMSERYPEVDTIDPGKEHPPTMPACFSPTANTEAMLVYSISECGKETNTRYTYAELTAKMQMLKEWFSHSSESVIVSCVATTSELGVLGHVLQTVFAKCKTVFMSPTMAYRKPIRWLLAMSDYSATTASAPKEVIELCNMLETIDPLPQLGTLNTCFSEHGVVGTEVAVAFTDRFAEYGLSVEAMKPFELRYPNSVSKMNFTSPSDFNSFLFADV